MKDLGYMSYKAALQYQGFFAEQDITVEIKDYTPFFHFLLGSGLGNNKKVHLRVKDEDFERAKALFDEQELKFAKNVADLTPAANRAMMIVGLVVLAGAALLFWLLTK